MDKRYDHQQVEKEAQELWAKEKIYKFSESSDKEIFSIDTPPPTVSGSLHIGHIFSYTQTDFVARYKRMQGYNLFYPMGFDNNGLPTERFVERKHKIRGHMLKRSEFISLCLKESKKTEAIFTELWKAIGLSIDWNKVYSTISDDVRKISQYSFIELYNKGLVYKKEEPALYCTTCRTTVAQAELDDLEVSTLFNDVEFKTSDGEKLVIATTRPELLPACVAIFYHPTDKRYAHLNGKHAVVPLFEKIVPILQDEEVNMEKGSGLVMCCTFGDQADVMWYKKHNLPFVQVVGRDGKWTKEAGVLSGLNVIEARKKTIELLKQAKLLLEQKKISHNVNVHERCKHEIEYLILNQWFVNILDHKDAFLSLADEIEWKPGFMKARYKDWVKNLNWDWCISRQRFYGVPFPVWYCQDCKQVLFADVEHLPIDPQEQEYPGKKCSNCSSLNIVPETDLMDTWNTSALTPQINIGWPEENGNLKLPMSLRAQAHDIIRTWTFYTIVKAYYHQKTIPWKQVALSGFIFVGKDKISKSKGNAPTDPEMLLKNYPADAIRYWAANGRLGVDSIFSEEQFKIGRRLLTKMWNAFRFCKDHIQGYKKQMQRPNLDSLNEWLLHQLSITIVDYKECFEKYEHTGALEVIEKFFWHDFCDNYLELVKDRMFNPDKYSADVIEETKFTLYETCFGILQLFAPFIPHVTEKLYQLLFRINEKSKSLHETYFDSKRYLCGFGESAKLIDEVVSIVSKVRKIKSEQKLSLKTELNCLTLYSNNQELLNAMQTQETILIGVTRAAGIKYCLGKIEESSIVHDNNSWNVKIKL